MKLEKEITVKYNDSYEKLHKSLIAEGFNIIDEYQLNDIYMLPNNINIFEQEVEILELLKKCILIRDIVGIKKELVYKYKKYDIDGNILEQGKEECEIFDTEDAVNFMKAINYKVLFKIFDKCIIYANKEIEIAVQLVNDKYVFIEVEDDCKNIGKIFSSVEDIIGELEKYDIDYDKSNYFIKKAEMVFKDNYK